jgi:hypothetical protein
MQLRKAIPVHNVNQLLGISDYLARISHPSATKKLFIRYINIVIKWLCHIEDIDLMNTECTPKATQYDSLGRLDVTGTFNGGKTITFKSHWL